MDEFIKSKQNTRIWEFITFFFIYIALFSAFKALYIEVENLINNHLWRHRITENHTLHWWQQTQYTEYKEGKEKAQVGLINQLMIATKGTGTQHRKNKQITDKMWQAVHLLCFM